MPASLAKKQVLVFTNISFAINHSMTRGTPSHPYILVTGGTGLVGSQLISDLIKHGKQVKALYRTNIPEGFPFKNVRWIKGDILDVISLEAAMQNVSQVYHCAAIVSFNPDSKMDMFKVNIEGTANVVNACLTAGVQQLCFVSSVAALGRIRVGELVNETMNWTKETSNSSYGQSKYLAELEVWRGVGEGLKAVVVNPVIILGAGDWNKGSSGLFKSAYNEFPWYTEGVSGFVDVKDLTKVMFELMEKNISGERYIICSENWKYKDLFKAMAKAFNRKPPHKKVTPLIASIVWRMEAIKSWFNKKDPLLTRETSHTAQSVVHFDNSKIRTALPAFVYTPLSETIERVAAEMKKRYL